MFSIAENYEKQLLISQLDLAIFDVFFVYVLVIGFEPAMFNSESFKCHQ